MTGSSDAPEKDTLQAPPSLEAVQIYWKETDDQGETQLYCAWINIASCDGFTWKETGPPNRGNPPQGKNGPFLKQPPKLGECTPVGDLHPDTPISDAPICWWSGSSWECGGL